MSRISDVINRIMQISGEMNIFYLVSFDKGFKEKKCFISSVVSLIQLVSCRHEL